MTDESAVALKLHFDGSAQNDILASDSGTGRMRIAPVLMQESGIRPNDCLIVSLKAEDSLASFDVRLLCTAWPWPAQFGRTKRALPDVSVVLSAVSNSAAGC